jgi:alpha-tubulin suppressor-like RCC1 family protein
MADADWVCAVLVDQSVTCWGSSMQFNLCVPSNGGDPTVIPALSPATDIVIKNQYACAIRDGGELDCAVGCTTQSVALDAGVFEAKWSLDHGCVRLSHGLVQCWGTSQFGETGNGQTASSTPPADVLGFPGSAFAVAVGPHHSCAIADGGSVWCWGHDDHGQLGDGMLADQATAVATLVTADATALCAGDAFTCAVRDGGVLCWGANDRGQLGAADAGDHLIPDWVGGLDAGVVQIACGSSHACAVTVQGALKCWGANDVGQLGDGPPTNNTPTDRFSAVDVSGK